MPFMTRGGLENHRSRAPIRHLLHMSRVTVAEAPSKLSRLMYRALFGWAAIGAATVWGLGFPAESRAARILVMEQDGRAVVQNDPFLAPAQPTVAPTASAPARVAVAGSSVARADRSVRAELARLRRSHAISVAAYRSYLGSFNAAL